MFWKILKAIASLFLPMFSRPRLSPGLVWFLHLLLIAGIAVGLYFLQQKMGWTALIGGKLTWIRDYWTPLLFLLIYFVIWQAYWVYKLLQPEAVGSPYPDLDEAWGQAIGSLEKAGIGIGDTPVFLVFGKVVGAAEAMFQAVPGGLAVTGATPGGSPVRAFANRDAIFVTCPGASLLGNPGRVQAGPSAGTDLAASIGSGGPDLAASIGMDRSIGVGGTGSIGGTLGGDVGRVQQIIRAARDQNRPLSDAERAEIRRLSEGGGAARMICWT
ncbi:MAG TPA: hypothetical protein VM597_21080, partial [Gemmataceae bacterium]|nr:hypothetical protein [Gemmataceae bacterium]